MKKGYLSQYFQSVGAKRLSAVEVDTKRSHQHEFNGTKELKKIFGINSGEREKYPTQFIWIGKENENISNEGYVTWYDARKNHPTRTEYRLYFSSTAVSERAEKEDIMIIAKTVGDKLLVIIASSESSISNQLLWLFDLQLDGECFVFNEIDSKTDKEIDFITRFILEEIGIEIEVPEAAMLDELVHKFNRKFPDTKEFSSFARETLKNINPLDDPDAALMAWMNQEEKLFKRLERQVVEFTLKSGFTNQDTTDVDGFIQFSLSVQNRRKARAGYALENHLEEIFKGHKIKFDRHARTENQSRPDFLFPGKAQYSDLGYPFNKLTMLGVKTTCKDRWRQVLAEADRIERKHLFTLEPGISENQTTEMQSKKLQLVIPQPIHITFKQQQMSELMNLKDFIKLVKDKQ